MPQHDPFGSVLNNSTATVAVVAVRRLANTLTLVLVKRTVDGVAMSIPLTKLLLTQQDTQGYETMMKSKNRPLRH